MQTFLSYADFLTSAHSLDTRCLCKQIVEVGQMLHALRQGPRSPRKDGTDGTRPTPWWSHPATQAWLGYESALATYGQACLTVYDERFPSRLDAYKNQRKLLAQVRADNYPDPIVNPPWVGYEPFHDGHRGHLYRKDLGKYAAFAPYRDSPLLYPVITQRGGTSTSVRYAERIERPGKPARFRLWPLGTEDFKTARDAVLARH